MPHAPVICYHRIGGPLELGVTRVARDVFQRQMRTLARTGWRTVTLSDLDSQADTSRAFLLSFDDGYADLAEHAYPVLADLGFTATTFLVTDYVGGTNAWDARYTWRPLRHLDWDSVERWQARGMTYGSHTASHPRLTWLNDARVSDELGRSRELLVRRLGSAAGQAIAYPFGAVDARVRRLAGAAGYVLGFGGVRSSAGKLEIPRVPVYLWDAFSVPLGLRGDSLGGVGRLAAHVANRCAVGTSLILRVLSRQRGRGREDAS